MGMPTAMAASRLTMNTVTVMLFPRSLPRNVLRSYFNFLYLFFDIRQPFGFNDLNQFILAQPAGQQAIQDVDVHDAHDSANDVTNAIDPDHRDANDWRHIADLELVHLPGAHKKHHVTAQHERFAKKQAQLLAVPVS